MTKELGNKNIAILHDNSTYAQGLAEETKKYLEELGVKTVFYDAINPKDKDFTPILTKIKAANPDASTSPATTRRPACCSSRRRRWA